MPPDYRMPGLVSLLALLVACASTPRGGGPLPRDDGTNWTSYNRTLAGDRFSPLAQIDRSNVALVQTLCTYTLPEVTSLQTGPVVVDGTMYFTTDTISYAIDAGT